MEHINCNLTLADFSHLKLTGIREVLSFEETQIDLSLGESILLICGKDLKIGTFSRESGTIEIDGEIDSLLREDSARPMRGDGFFSRLFHSV